MSEIIDAHIDDKTVKVPGDQAISLFNKGHYGTPEAGGLRLNGFEALHLLELKRISIKDNEKPLTPEHLIEWFSRTFEDFMLRYMVYKDLRTRGYVVTLGTGSSFFFRLYDRNVKPRENSARYYVRPLQEGGSISMLNLEDLITISNKSKKILLIGMVDAVGDVSYLSVNHLIPNNINEDKTFSNLKQWDWTAKWDEYQSWDD